MTSTRSMKVATAVFKEMIRWSLWFFSILLAISVLTDFSLSFTFLKQGVTCP